MKYEWRKAEKKFYCPKPKPEKVVIPKFKFFTVAGEGNPNDEYFAEYIGALYSLSYAVKMSLKKGIVPKGYFDYTVYPLEGVWDINEDAKKEFSGTLNKDDLVFNLMIRQPNFVNQEFADMIIELVKKNKPHELLDKVKFDEIKDGTCVQMLHLGRYDDEPRSFKLMEEYAEENGLVRKSKVHREIYLSDARKVAPEKLKTVLRFQVKGNNEKQ
ncbi:GyrI-like domain-containing protein [bacterium]|nr:GyrI-like domain-containing protein [bacterium]